MSRYRVEPLRQDSASPCAARAAPGTATPAATASPRAAEGPVAILVAHGMGQQVRFRTLDDVAEGLLAEDARRRGRPAPTSPVARTVKLGSERLQRLELTLRTRRGTDRDVHVYEAYWAPLTEGRVTLRDVALFLLRSGVNGLWSLRAPFRRWVFGAYEAFPRPARTGAYLGLALLVVTATFAANAITAVMALTFVLPGAVALLPAWARALRAASAGASGVLAWTAAVLLSVLVRHFLIEYVGDVAAYVQPQVLDRFAELREKIKETVWRTARAVYGDPAYEDVILVGHSLGSVVVYDVLNRLILDRALGVADAPDIVGRTRLLVTFGSPLDKTAFVFGAQGTGSEAREALAASLQPLIADDAVRPRWVNIHAPADIISGQLDCYDRPDRSNRRPVRNLRDPRARVPVVAHVQYWKNPLLFRTIGRVL